MSSLINFLWAMTYLAVFIGGILLGYNLKKESSGNVVVPQRAKKKYTPQYNASDLLEPITPADQRLEKMLEKQKDKEVTDGGED